ncbi:MAG TPA: right-handed parallel beta-helix repeat-containing protein [Streptosporangiaceae bacterium]|nr:right-handed parallel beta-helix repeat-containing protein [Streptosporangiaceae bacterium]
MNRARVVPLLTAATGFAWLAATMTYSPAVAAPPSVSPHATAHLGRSVPQSAPRQAPATAAAPASHAKRQHPRASRKSAIALATNHVRVCGNAKVLGAGPTKPPKGAIVVHAGNNSRVQWGKRHATYWFAPGVHTLGRGQYSQIDPGDNSRYIGAPGAVINGRHLNNYAFGGRANSVTISYLTIKGFGKNGGNFDQGVINVDSSPGWTIDHSLIRDNAGAGVMLGSRDRLSYDCLRNNQQYGFNAYSSRGPAHLTLDHNEIAGNDTFNWEARKPGCGCTGGGKFWYVNGAVITDNWVHDNHSVGLWADTDNRGFDFDGNYFEANYDSGLMYEISYNASITNNLFERNAIGRGRAYRGFPVPALYVSESGSDWRVHSKYRATFVISGNTFINNWSGIVLWENSNRFCGSPANSSSGNCTLDEPKVANLRTCTESHLRNAKAAHVPDYYDLCRWKTRNVSVTKNQFSFVPKQIGSDCTLKRGCGVMGLFSEWGSYPSWSPYLRKSVEYHITFDQGNHFAGNTYAGPWKFMVLEQNNVVGWSAWQHHFGQDSASTLSPNP